MRNKLIAATELAELAARALAEDLGHGDLSPARDITTHWILDDGVGSARIVARQTGVVAGLDAARCVFAQVDPTVHFLERVSDGDLVAAEAEVVSLNGPVASLLTAERTALNFLQHLSGIATLTRQFAEAIQGTGSAITDTRKTTPGLRELEKRAVELGGGVNHRMGLYDAVLIKENHADAAGGVESAVSRARRAAEAAGQSVPIYAEARDFAEVEALLAAAPDRIMLDNMSVEQMDQAVASIRRANPHAEIEATGGITLNNVRQVAGTGVNLISVGTLTHSAPAFDYSLLLRD